MKSFLISIAFGGCLAVLLGAIAWEFKYENDTNPPGHLSGLRLLTDAKTGCQYLSNPFGGITPRMDADGKQVCGGVR